MEIERLPENVVLPVVVCPLWCLPLPGEMGVVQAAETGVHNTRGWFLAGGIRSCRGGFRCNYEAVGYDEFDGRGGRVRRFRLAIVV